MDDSLDKTYGGLLKLGPDEIHPLELEVRPLSLQQLGPEAAFWLKSFMQATQDGLGVTRFVYCVLPILWLADKDGVIWFAVEEIVDEQSKEFVLPRIPVSMMRERQRRLGHPALVGGNTARIAGEILFDVRSQPPTWIITNGSGRFGTKQGRRLQHLNNVCARFREYDIDLVPTFFEPW